MSVTFSDIAAMLASRPSFPDSAPTGCVANLARPEQQKLLAIPQQWQDILLQLGRIGKTDWPQITHPRVVLYAASYGTDNSALKQRLQQLAAQQDALTGLCALLNADLRVYELDIDHAVPPEGLDENAACHALSYGLMAVEEHVDGLITGLMDEGARDILQSWAEAIDKEAEHSPATALETLRQCGAGADLFALAGAICAARMARIPVFLAGETGRLWARILPHLFPDEPVAHYIVLPENAVADGNDSSADPVVTTIAALNQLRFYLALVPVASRTRTIQPVAA